MKTKIVFWGSDEYSLAVLKSLIKDKRFEIAGIVTLPHAKIIQKFAQEKKLPLINPTSIIRIIEEIKSKRPEIGVLASFGKILPKEVLSIPKHGVLNIHPSLLPKYRGPTPVPTAILNGDQETGVTIIKMDEKVDHGLIVSQFKEPIKPDDTAQDLLRRLFSAGAEVLKTILPAYLEGQIKLREQDHSKATFTKKLARDDGKINWKKSAEFLDRFIRAMHPWPGSWCWVKISSPKEVRPPGEVGPLKRLKLLGAHLEPTIRDRKEKSYLILDQVQLEGKKPVAWEQFQEGYPEAKLI